MTPEFLGIKVSKQINKIIYRRTAQYQQEVECEALVSATRGNCQTEGLLQKVGFKKMTEFVCWRTSVSTRFE